MGFPLVTEVKTYSAVSSCTNIPSTACLVHKIRGYRIHNPDNLQQTTPNPGSFNHDQSAVDLLELSFLRFVLVIEFNNPILSLSTHQTCRVKYSREGIDSENLLLSVERLRFLGNDPNVLLEDSIDLFLTISVVEDLVFLHIREVSRDSAENPLASGRPVDTCNLSLGGDDGRGGGALLLLGRLRGSRRRLSSTFGAAFGGTSLGGGTTIGPQEREIDGISVVTECYGGQEEGGVASEVLGVAVSIPAQGEPELFLLGDKLLAFGGGTGNISLNTLFGE